MILRRPHAAMAAALLAATALQAHAAPPACPFKPEQLGKVFGPKFDAGKEEPGIGGTSCQYRALGTAKEHTDYRVWVLILPPGANQDMMRQMTAGGPKARFDPIAGDPDGASRVRGGAGGDGLVDVSYQRGGHVVFLRASLDHEPDAKAREARAAGFAAKLLQLPRLP